MHAFAFENFCKSAHAYAAYADEVNVFIIV